MRRVTIDFQIGLIAIAAAIVIGVTVAKGGLLETRRTRDTIAVTGSAKKPIDADLAQWHLVIAIDDRTAQRAAQRLEPQMAQVRKFLAGGGIEQQQVELPPLQTEEYVRKLSKKRSIRIVRASQTIDISSRDLDKMEALGRDLGRLVRGGIGVSADRIAFISTRLVQARIQTLDAATADAHRRAETIVKGLGGKLGRLRRAELGVYQVTPRFSTEVSDYGINDTSSREKDVTAVVSVTFEVKR